jgi:imidazolonepropionase
MRLAGAAYLDILRAGGGIMSTVRAVRAAPEEILTELLVERLLRMAANGAGTVEVKSGYGLTTDDELKMLRAIRAAADRTRQLVIPTFLGAHAVDHAQPGFVDRTINETLPAVAMEFPGIVCDAFCEEGAWSLADTRRLFESALSLGCRLRVHTDQFNSLGMTRLALDMGAASVDHLEALTPADLSHVAHSSTVAVALPMSGFQLDDRYAPARELVDAGAAVAVASNLNPGTALVSSMPAVVALAVRKLRRRRKSSPPQPTTPHACSARRMRSAQSRSANAPTCSCWNAAMSARSDSTAAFRAPGWWWLTARSSAAGRRPGEPVGPVEREMARPTLQSAERALFQLLRCCDRKRLIGTGVENRIL